MITRETERIFLNQKKKKSKKKKSLHKPARKNLCKSKIEEIKETLYDSIINRDDKIEEIKKILYDPRNNLFKTEEELYKPVTIGNAFSSNYIEYKTNGDKYKNLSIKDYLDEIDPYLSDIINDHKTDNETDKIIEHLFDSFS